MIIAIIKITAPFTTSTMRQVWELGNGNKPVMECERCLLSLWSSLTSTSTCSAIIMRAKPITVGTPASLGAREFESGAQSIPIPPRLKAEL